MTWPLNDIYLALRAQMPGIKVEILQTIDSTNSELMRRAKNGLTDPLLLIAEEQTAGKGRLGRTWYARPGDALTFSLGLELSAEDWSGFSLAIGLGILNGLDPQRSYPMGLKWPNDIWLGPAHTARKLGGILIESTISSQHNPGAGRARYCVIGVGINLVAPEGLDLSRAAAGMCELDPTSTPASVLITVGPQIIKNILRFEAQGFNSFQNEFADCDLLMGQQVSMSNGLTGRACGVNSSGEFLIQTQSGVVPVTSDEVSLVGIDF
jgi:BirA family biotin operon repressor/biotin-[acetyl-CoA-carboxylase] ligase